MLAGSGGGHNDGVYSTGNGLALTLSVIPSIGDRSVFVNDMDENVVRKNNPWQALVDPKYNSGAKFTSIMKERITGDTSRPWQALVDPKYNSEAKFTSIMKERITGDTSRPWQALVDPKYNSGKSFFEKFKEEITGKTYSTTVNPKLSVPQTYKTAMGDLTDTKTVNVEAKLSNGSDLKCISSGLTHVFRTRFCCHDVGTQADWEWVVCDVRQHKWCVDLSVMLLE